MPWLIPALLFVAAVVFWRLSFHTDDAVAAWCRFLLACFLLSLALIFAGVQLVHGWIA
ncbi:hypothetical protein ACUTAF_02050 [Pseudomonas sp. SP16.1]|uniref:hypothetical protein n=1 Tax=Pseudomonas sp. SP16.1 TaxID=3458854 RepID=UPI00404618BF